jgi:multisubunit Na+/H+ antiporter MnhF subunit
MLASAWYVVPGVPLRSLTAAAVVFSAWSATGHWYERLRCPEDPWVQTFIEQKMLQPSRLVPGLGGAAALSALSSVRDNVLRSSRYVSETFLRGTYNGSWLPRSEPPRFASAVNAAVAIVWIGVGLLAAWTLARLAVGAVRTRRLSQRTVMVFALFVPLAGLALLEGHKAFYESSLVLPLLAFVPALGLRCPPGGRGAGVARAASAALLAVSLASMATLWATVLPHLPGWLARGYVPRQRLSISAFGAADARDQVQIAARLCGIDPSRTMDHLVVDGLTYTAFDHLRQPYFALYVFDPWRHDVRRLLANRGSAGMVISCGAVPRPLLRRTRRFGPLCCMPPFALAKDPHSGYTEGDTRKP